jgi:hypothetical protein
MDGAFVQLSPLGLFPHARGFQNVDRTALELLVKNFNSFLSRLGRRFVGVPFYVGHPDVRGLEHLYPDRKAYGWIMDLQVREDGLYGRPKWSEAGRDLIANGHYKFLSPYWTADRAGDHQGRPVFRPTQLISVGLTNEPNLPVLPLANSSEADLENGPANLLGEPVALEDAVNAKSEIPNPKSKQEENGGAVTPATSDLAPGISDLPNSPISDLESSTSGSSPAPTSALGPRPSDLSDATSPLDPRTSHLATSSPISDLEFNTSTLSSSTSALGPRPSDLCSSSANPAHPSCPLCNSPSSDLTSASVEELHALYNSLLARISEVERVTSAFDARTSHLEQRFVNTLLDRAIAETRIAPAERSYWRDALAADFENAARELTFAAPKLNLTSRAETLPLRPAVPTESSEKQRRVLALVNEKMRATGLSFHHAWLQTKSEHPALIS